MPILFKDSPEPQTEKARSRRPTMISSSARERLSRELLRYARGQVHGRSFLIAGHRGAGKTTMVKAAIDQLTKELEEEHLATGGRPRRPLLVMLHGPNLLPTPPPEGGDEDADGNDDQNDSEPDANPKRGLRPAPVRDALVQIVLGLYRALADEVTRSYRERMEGTTESGLPLEERLELAAELVLELDRYPGPERLRFFWNAPKLLQKGVLFPAPDEQRQVAEALPTDQGLREIVALRTASYAYQRISGEFTKRQIATGERQTGSQNEEEKGDRPEKTVLREFKDLLPASIAVLTGGLAGAGTLATDKPPLLALLIGLAATLIAAAAFRFSWSTRRVRTVEEESTFMENTSVDTLDRAIPSLVRRLYDAGLVPVFVVDELDKVRNLSQNLIEIVRHLKKLVAEQAFFCFLTDRTYFERLTQRSRDEPYPVEHTYFSERAFVVFGSEDLHHYLNQILVPPEHAASGRETSESGSGGRDDHGFDLRDELEWRADYPVVPYLLLYDSRMHPIDLRRRLNSILRRLPSTDGAEVDYLDLPPGEVRSRRRDRLKLLSQISIELVMANPELTARIEAKPAFRRLAHDALYYLPRIHAGKPIRPPKHWYEQRGEKAPDHALDQTVLVRNRKLDLSTEQASKTFREYLKFRMLPDPGRFTHPDEQGLANEIAPDPADLILLFARVQEQAEYLSDPVALLGAINERVEEGAFKALDRVLIGTLPLNPTNGPLLRLAANGSRHIYEWGYNAHGNPVTEGQREPLGYQLDTTWRLGVQATLGADEFVGELKLEPFRRDLARHVLMRPHRLWRTSTTIKQSELDLTNTNQIRGWADEWLRDHLPSTVTEGELELFRRMLAYQVELMTADPRDSDSPLWTPTYAPLRRQFRPSGLVMRRVGDEDKFQWRFDANGHALDPTEQLFYVAPWNDQAQFIRTVEPMLREVFEL